MNESKKKDRYEDAKKFVRYSDGAKMYSMGMTKFQEVAKDANPASGTRMRILTRCLWSGILTKRQDAALTRIT